ncbi:hypothetical protein UFOVP401_25 [uncultured Caudovirales phage]|uniref:Uncharacterized protein n=1 Tax=uncultured Caudovirales phage TaxID=2100421 RepID=A0A6J5MB42_9CAUD|nr:hypothetical protein UFOVP401_25 [uncultured Caudovirales phage]
MAKQRPSLGVSAAPVSTYVASVAPAVELYDQQSVNLALQFADAFKDLSVSAAQIAGSMKKQMNEEDVQKGIDLVNQSRKSYKTLVDSGEIKPTENPWMAIGAQQASGTMEGMKARAHFSQVYERRSQEDPAFFDGSSGFDALATQYTQNVNSVIGNAPYMSRAFYEAFNPYIASMGMKHEEKVTEVRNQRVLVGVGAEVGKAVADLRSPDKIVSQNASLALQEAADDFIRSGYSAKQINEAIVDNLINQMATAEDVEAAEQIFDSLKSGTALLKDTEYAKAALTANRAKIENNRNRLTMQESRQFYEWWQDLKPSVVSGKITQEQALEKFNQFVEGPDRKISITGPEAESKRSWILNEIEQGKAEAKRELIKEQENTVLGVINSSSQIPTEFLNNEEGYRGYLEDKMETMFSTFGMDEAQKLQYRGVFERVWGASEQKRAEYRIAALSESIWTGDLGPDGNKQNGLDVAAATQFANFLSPPKGEMPSVPQFVEMKARIDDKRSLMGVAPDTEKAQTLYRQDYDRLDRILTAQEEAVAQQFNGNLNPTATDSPTQLAAKADIRSRFRFLRMRMGTVFNDDREVRKATLSYNAATTPITAERGEELTAFEDTLAAYRLSIQNGIDINQVVLNPQSPNGKRMVSELKWAMTQLSSGANAANIQRDIAAGRVFGSEIDTNFFDRNNPWGWLEFNSGSGIAAEEFNTEMTGWRESNGITEPDAIYYTSAEFFKHYSNAVRGEAVGNNKKALRIANAAMERDNLLVRGSLIPKKNLSPSVDSEYLEAYLRVNYPKAPNATFVVVQTTTDGALLAVRENGIALDNKLIRSTDLNPSGKNPEIVDMVRKIYTEKRASRKGMDIGKPKVGEPKF